MSKAEYKREAVILTDQSFVVDKIADYVAKELKDGSEYPGAVILLLFAAHFQMLRLNQEGVLLKDDKISQLFRDYLKIHPNFSEWAIEINRKLKDVINYEGVTFSEANNQADTPLLPSKSSFMVGLDGPNGVGKSTIAGLVVEEMSRKGYQVKAIPREANAKNFSHHLLKGQFRAESTHSKFWDSLTETFITSAAIYHHYSHDVPESGIGFFDRGEASHFVYNAYNLLVEYPILDNAEAFELIDLLLRMYRHNNLSIVLYAPEQIIIDRLKGQGVEIPEEFAFAIPTLNKLYVEYTDRIGERGVLLDTVEEPHEVKSEVISRVIEKYENKN